MPSNGRLTHPHSNFLPIAGRDEAIVALKESVKLENPSDWQLLIELTSGRPGAAVNAALLLAGAPDVGADVVTQQVDDLQHQSQQQQEEASSMGSAAAELGSPIDQSGGMYRASAGSATPVSQVAFDDLPATQLNTGLPEPE